MPKFSYTFKLPPCPADEPGAPTINLWLMTAARYCQKWKKTPQEALDLLVAQMPESRERRGKNNYREAQRAVEKVYSTAFASTSTTQREPVRAYDPELLERQASQVPFEITDDWLRERSQVTNLDEFSPAEYLDTIFQSNEQAAVCPTFYHAGFVYQPGNSDHTKRMTRLLKHNEKGAWFLTNPVNGAAISGSVRSEANLTSFRHLLLESDNAPRALWLRVLVQLQVPILSIIESGNKSIHALVRINAASRSEFDAQASKFKREMVPLGACPAAISAVRLSRLANVKRNDNGRSQRLLYLNPNADATPIRHREAFSPLF